MKKILFCVAILLITSTICRGEETIKPAIACFIADLKYDGESIKILEFGNIERAQLNGHSNLYEEGKIWHRLWHYLTQYNIPIWYIGTFCNKKTTIDFPNFKKFNITYKYNINELQYDQTFQHSNKGIIIFGSYKGEHESFRKKHSNFLFLNNYACNFVRNKHKTAELFNDDELHHYKPQWNIYPKKYTPSLAQQIYEDFSDHNIIVIKPINAVKGKGVIIIEKKSLDKTLNLILKNKKELQKIIDITYNYWLIDQNDTFIVESFERSTPVIVENKSYDGTMRVVFILDSTSGEIDVTFLGSYWKLPYKSLSDTGTLTEKYKSKVNKSRAFSSAKVNPEDEAHVYEILREILPKIYKKMLE